MSTLSDDAPFYTGEALGWEPNKNYSRDNITVASGAGKVKTCTVMGRITASKEYVPVNPAANDGSQVASAVLIEPVDATSAAKKSTAWRRTCTLKKAQMNFGALDATQIATAIEQLAAVGIVVRDAV